MLPVYLPNVYGGDQEALAALIERMKRTVAGMQRWLRVAHFGKTGIAALIGFVVIVLPAATWLSVQQRASAFDHTRIWTIGTDNTYPYHFLQPGQTESSTADGMAAVVVSEAARRAGIRLHWKAHPEGPYRAIGGHDVELWPLLSTVVASKRIYVSAPYLRNDFVYVGVDPRFTTVDGRSEIQKVSVIDYPLTSHYAEREFPKALIVKRRNRVAVMDALCTGQADVALLEARTLQHYALNRPEFCRGVTLHSRGLDVPPALLGIASTPAAAVVADRLRSEIEDMLADGTMARLMRPWNYYYGGESELLFREKVSSDIKRVALALAAVLAILSSMLLLVTLRLRRIRTLAETANAAKSQFLANMSHEIRTPLNGILGIAEILRSTHLSTEQREFVQMLRSSGENLLSIVNDVLDLARVETGRLRLEPVPVSPAILIRDAAEPLRATALLKGISFRVEGLESLPPAVYADPVRVRQVLANLIANAVKFTGEGGVTVRVSCVVDKNSALISIEVADTGIGIAGEARERLFEKFYQADSSISRRFGGTGLGLSISQSFARAMKGTITYESNPGTGSTFRFVAPFRLANREELQHGILKLETLARSTPAKILVAEDNQTNERIVRRMLENLGHKVISVPNGAECVARFAAEEFDLVLMDCQMPVLDGYQATAEIRKLATTRALETPIVALTASAMKGERDRCLAVGMNDFLSKPITVPELHRVLDQCLHPALERNATSPPAPAPSVPKVERQ